MVSDRSLKKLLGSIAFALDRMIAILGALLEENDIDGRLIPPQFSIPGEFMIWR
jgi:origin recognition complex subunit 5